MAKKRLVETAIWDDSWFSELSLKAKFIFLYLLTNPRLRESGFIEITHKAIKNDTDIQVTKSILSELEKKVIFDKEYNLYLLLNFYKKNCKSPKMIQGAINDIEKYKNSRLALVFCDINNHIEEFQTHRHTLSIGYAYPTDTLGIGCNGNSSDSENEVKRYLKKEVISDASFNTHSKKIDYENFVWNWNNITNTVYFATCQKLTEQRKRAIRIFCGEFGTDAEKTWVDVIKKCNESKFLRGENNSGWVANFDWVINKNNAIKILEGNYDNKNNGDDFSDLFKNL